MTRLDFQPTSQGNQTIEQFAGIAYDAADRLTPLMNGEGSGVFKEATYEGQIVRYPIAPPMIAREKFIASVRSSATKK